MRVILYDSLQDKRSSFYPLSLSRPIWELRCGMSSLAEKILSALGASDAACFVMPYMAESYKAKTDRKVNDPSTLKGEDLVIVYGSVKAESLKGGKVARSEVALDAQGNVLLARIAKADAAKLPHDSLEALLAAAAQKLPKIDAPATWNYTWDLVLENPAVIRREFAALGRSGIEGTVEQPNAIRGDAKDVYVARGATIHPMVVLDAAGGPIYIDEGAEVHPFSRVEGPCYLGKKSILFGAKCREGMSIGPVCRVGGEVEESIIQGHSNKYHDGFLGHAYVGEWVNLGAMTTNSDLKNDYSNVSVILDGKTPIDTGSTKVGSLIGDHTKTSIGTLFNTGANVGAMSLIMTTGKPLPKFIPSFSWLLDGNVTKGFGRGKLYETAKVAMSRRKKEWTPVEEAMWDAIFELTADVRMEAIKKGRKAVVKK